MTHQTSNRQMCSANDGQSDLEIDRRLTTISAETGPSLTNITQIWSHSPRMGQVRANLIKIVPEWPPSTYTHR